MVTLLCLIVDVILMGVFFVEVTNRCTCDGLIMCNGTFAVIWILVASCVIAIPQLISSCVCLKLGRNKVCRLVSLTGIVLSCASIFLFLLFLVVNFLNNKVDLF